jgi:arsenate reductase
MKYVLFVCTHNAGRSQIAQASFERDAPADIRAESAGEEPAAAIWPNVIEAMREVGIDISRRAKKLDVEMQLHADWAITLHCKASCPFVPSQVEDWEVDDPAGQPLERVREIRDEIRRRVEALVAAAGWARAESAP